MLYKIIAFTGIIIIQSSCNKHLDREPLYQSDINSAVVDYPSANAVLNGVYYSLEDYYMGGQIFMRLASQTGLSGFATALSGETATEADGGFSGVWSALYRSINSANVANTAISALPENVFPSPAKKKQMVAEARCVRAFCYSYLHWLYSRWWDTPDSKFGILYRDRKPEYYETQMARLTVGESYQTILGELDFCIENLPDYTTTGKRATKQFAMALKAKLLLIRGKGNDYADALAILNQVVAFSSAGSYQLAPTAKALYDASWDSKENLFCRYLESGTTSKRYFNDVAYSQSIVTQTPLNPFYNLIKLDPRYPTVFGTVTVTTGNVVAAYPNAAIKVTRKGYYNDPEDLYTAYYLRYAEVLLMQAELRARINPADIAGALIPLNQVIKRAGGTELTVATITSKQALMDAIYNQYIMELFYENGSELYASLRFTDASGTPKLLTMRNTTVYNQDRISWQIPAVETSTNLAMIKNPGY